MLGKFPRYTFYVGRLPGKDAPILTEELDERAFLFGIQVRPNGGDLGGIAYHKFHRLGLDGGLEAESEIFLFDAGISESSTLLWISLNSSL